MPIAGMTTDFQQRIQHLIDLAGGQSALARRAGLSLGAIQRYLKGGEPTRGALMQLAECCAVPVEWLVYGTGDETGPAPARAAIPVFGFAECGLAGWYNATPSRLTTSMDWPDPDLCAVMAAGHSMTPEGIQPGFLCIASPATAPQVNDAVLIRKHDGTATIKILLKREAEWITVKGWLDPESPGGPQTPFTDKIQTRTIDSLATIIMVRRRL